MDRGIDHLVLAVNELDTAAKHYEQLGFTLTPRALHPWGTANQLVQVQGSFLEIIEVAEPAKLLPPTERQFSFGAYLDRYLSAREGLAMTVFEGHDARADRDEFAANGLPDLDPFDFERQAVLPDGSSVTVGFSLAFVPPSETPEAVFFTCQQHAPQYFWKSEYQKHANTAQTVEEVVMIADDPAELAGLFGKMQGADAVTLSDGDLTCHTARGLVRVLRPASHIEWYGEAHSANAPGTPHFSAMRVGVRDLEKTQSVLSENGIETRWARAGLIVPAISVHGCTLAFAQI